LLLGLIVWAFLPAIQNGFINYDDELYVTANRQVQQGLTGEGIAWAFRSTETGNWHPVTWLSHMLDCQLFGLRPWGHHLTNLLLHAANTLLLFLLLRRMTGAVWRSVFVAALFGLHPLRVESVAWVAERKDVLSTLFWLLTLWAYAKFAGESNAQGAGRKFFYRLALAFFAFGLMSKPMLVAIPFALLLLDYWPLDRWKRESTRNLVIGKIPFFALAAVAGVITLAAQSNAGAVAAGNLPFANRVENALVSYARYLGKIFWPTDLSVFYPHPGHWPMQAVLLSSLLFLGISLSAFALRRQRPYLLMGWLWFVGTLAPVIGLVQAGSQSMADRYTYVPAIGVLVILAWGCHELAMRWRHGVMTFSAIGMAAILVCAALTRQQVGYWKDDETLFQRAIATTKDNYVAHTNLGTALSRKGDLDGAIAEYQKALAAKPNFVNARRDLGIALFQKKRLDEAITELQQAISDKPDYAAAHYNLGVVLNEQGRLDEAMSQFQAAAKLDPRNAEARYRLGLGLFKNGQLDDAISQYQEVLRLQPGYAPAHNDLGVALGRKGRLDEAISQYQAALALGPSSADIRYNLGNALLKQGRLDEGISQLEEALKLMPDSADAHNNVGVALVRKGSLDEAIFHFQEVLRLKPDNAEARTNLAAVLRMKGRPASQSTNSPQP